MKAHHERLQELVHAIFVAAGCAPPEAQCISHHLVESNLAGHDSHGVIRIPRYVDWIRDGILKTGSDVDVVLDSDALAVVDGQYRFGQVVAEKVTEMAISKAERHGVGVVALRRGGHVGRVGHWVEMAAAVGKVSLCFVNTSGIGMLVAPFGGIDRRLSANPVAAGIPVPGREPIIMDISTSTVAEGKLQVARSKGESVASGLIIDSDGQPTTDPHAFYGNPPEVTPGALLPFGGHKGFALGLVAEILAGALTGNSCSSPGVTQFSQGMLMIVLDIDRLAGKEFYDSDLARYVDFVKSSRTVTPDGEVLLPGEPEQRNRAHRKQNGIELDENSWNQIVEVATNVKVPGDTVQAAVMAE